MTQQSYPYHITTKERTYNSIRDKDHFQEVRFRWGDQSEIVSAWEWKDGQWRVRMAKVIEEKW